MPWSDDAVGWTADLDLAELLLVTAFRNAAVALGQNRPAYWANVESDLSGIADPNGARAALPAFQRLMSTLGRHTRSQIRFHTPDCPCLGHDEAAFLRIWRAAHAGFDGRAEREAGELVDPAMASTLVRQIAAFDAALGTLEHPRWARPHDAGDHERASTLH